jgi:mannosyl-oligosaccharide alpha-1,2-mannosidase
MSTVAPASTFLRIPFPLPSLPASNSLASFSISFLLSFPSTPSPSIRTVLSAKASGCPTDSSHHGLALYVNNWDTADHNLVLEYGNDLSGCNKVTSTEPLPVTSSSWLEITLSYDQPGSRVSMFANGLPIGQADVPNGSLGGIRAPSSSSSSSSLSMTIGQNNEEEDTLMGNLADLKFYTAAAISTSSTPAVSYPLADVKKTGGALDIISNKLQGNYVQPKPESTFVPAGGGRYDEYKDGSTSSELSPTILQESDDKARIRREEIKDSMKFVWAAYTKYAFGMDELKPLSLQGHNPWGGMGTTLVDSLDTLWLMGMKDEFYQGRDWVRDHLDHEHVGQVSVFETTIRSLGGLLSAYDLSGDKAFLNKAEDLGQRLFHAFDSPSGLPYGQTVLNRGSSMNAGWTGGSSLLAEVGTLQVEFNYLSRVTGKSEYKDKGMKVFEFFAAKKVPNGLYPIYINTQNGNFNNNKITFGAMGDSFYEYMLKTWLQLGEKDEYLREMFDDSMDGVHSILSQKSSPSGLSYIADFNGGQLDHKMDHLVCFMGGALALGAYTNPEGIDSPRSVRDMKLAKAITYTCYQMYARQPTGIAPEFVRFPGGKDMVAGSNAPFYILRPETVESLFILHYLTKDPIYREWGYEIYQAIEKHCKTPHAYGGLPDVTNPRAKPDDRMESFFLAETMKYLYLLQDPDTEIDIVNTHVFNTEAHPLTRLDKVKW